jgi:hypothetical protein
MFTARYGLIPYMKHVTFRLLKVNTPCTVTLVCMQTTGIQNISSAINTNVFHRHKILNTMQQVSEVKLDPFFSVETINPKTQLIQNAIQSST